MTTQTDAVPNQVKRQHVTRKSSISVIPPKVSTILNYFQEPFVERKHFKTDKFEYSRSGNEAGLVFIVNQENFLDKEIEQRRGSRRDVNELIICFQRLGFNIDQKNILPDATTEVIHDRINNIADEDFSGYNSLIFFYLSHGCEHNRLHTYDGTIAAHDIWGKFKENPSFKNKPKMFVFQACKGEGKSTTGASTSFKPSSLVPPSTFQANNLYPDLLIVYSTVEGNVSFRNSLQGSWFIQELCKNFSIYGKRDDVVSLIIRTSKCVASNYYHTIKEKAIDSKQMPLFVSTLRKKFYLNVSKDRDLLLRVIETNEQILKELKDINKKLNDDGKKKKELK
ncbi:caspase-3-like [Diorhabda sublineata]|uniref:caspase-3-like n=1 Tax=Diorhabda sublineata TaxID=1163346 RepID=UPI0024E0F1A7|nr:caspase-3-like [Diorhabda sublineata]